MQASTKTSLPALAEHIKSRMDAESYAGKMQRNPQLALVKVMEEYWEVVAAHQNNQTIECSDLLAHFLMYLNGIGVSLEDILNELNKRRWIPKLLNQQKNVLNQNESKEIIIGIMNSKYIEKVDQFAQEQLGIKVIRYSDRILSVKGEIIDQKKFSKYFGYEQNRRLSLLTSKPKDMIWLLGSKRVTHIITFNTIVENYPKIYSTILEIIDPTICLALIYRKGDSIVPEKWTHWNKPLIATEYICQVTKFFEDNNISHEVYHLDKITGSSENFLINSDKYLLSDAIVETGQTLEQNHLEIWQTIVPKGQIRIGLYGSLN